MPMAGGSKPRPAIVLREMPPFRDLLVCGVSTQLHQAVHGFDEVIAATHGDFASSGLHATSLIRLGFLQVTARRDIAGTIESISSARHRRLLQTLSDYLVQ
jgi:mRNA interferase MazF